jgi:hypothetical protein
MHVVSKRLLLAMLLLSAASAQAAAATSRSPAKLERIAPFGGGAEVDEAIDIDRPTDPRDSMLQPIRLMLGRGFNSILRAKRGQGCVAGTFAPPETGKVDPLPGSANMQMELLQSADDLKRDMSFEASVDGGFGSFTASASAKEQRSSEEHKVVNYLVIKSRFIGPEIVVNVSNLSDQAKALHTQSPLSFYKACGDEFTSTVQTGAQFFAVFSFEAVDTKDSVSIETSLKAAVGTNSASAEFKSNLQTAASKSRTDFRAWRIGGSGALPANNLDEIIAYATKFTGTITDSSQLRPVGETTQTYSTVILGFDSLSDDVVANRDAINQMIDQVSHGIFQLNHLPSYYQALDILISQDEAKADATLKAGLNNALTTMTKARAKCAADPFTPENCGWSDAISNFEMPLLPPKPIVTAIPLDAFPIVHQAGSVPLGYTKGLRLDARGLFIWRRGGDGRTETATESILPLNNDLAEGCPNFTSMSFSQLGADGKGRDIRAKAGSIVLPGTELWLHVWGRCRFPQIPEAGSYLNVILY